MMDVVFAIGFVLLLLICGYLLFDDNDWRR